MTAKTFSLQSDPKNLQPFLRESVAPLLEKSGFDKAIGDSVLVALGEAITNSIRHSYGGETGHPIDITFEENKKEVIFRIRDYGQPVDLKKIEAKYTPELPPVNPGGLGVYFMKTIMDSMEYNTAHSTGNELILTKKK